MITREELINGLRGFRAMIIEADEWRPMADYILELARQGFLGFGVDTAECRDCKKMVTNLIDHDCVDPIVGAFLQNGLNNLRRAAEENSVQSVSHGALPRPDCSRSSCPICKTGTYKYT